MVLKGRSTFPVHVEAALLVFLRFVRKLAADFRQEEIAFCKTIRRWAKTPVQIALGGLGVLPLRSLLDYFKLGS